MGKSIKVVFIKQSPADTFGGLYIRTIENRISRKRSLKITIQERDFQRYFDPNSQRFREDKRFLSGVSFNEVIEEALDEVKSYDSRLEDIPNKNKSFIDYWQHSIRNTPNHGTRIKNEVVLSKLMKFLSTRELNDLKFAEINPIFLKELNHYLMTVSDPKKLGKNSVVHYMKMIKAVINKARKDDYYYFTKDPFHSLSFKTTSTDKPILSDDDLMKLLNAELVDEKMRLYRNMFVFQLFSNGMRVSDLVLLTWGDIKQGRITYRMFKTNRLMSIPLNFMLSSIITELMPQFFPSYEKFKQTITSTFYYEEDGKLDSITLNLPKAEKLIRHLRVPKFTYNPITNFLMAEYRDKQEYEMGRTLDIDGVLVPDENDTLKRAAMFRLDLKKKIDEEFMKEVKKGVEVLNREQQLDFVFPILNSDDFDVENIKRDDTFIKESEYRRIKHHTIVYNRNLKKLQKLCGLETPLTSHVSRHTFTNMMLKLKDANLYDISMSLGHSKLVITEKYIRQGFNIEKVDYLNEELTQKFRNR